MCFSFVFLFPRSFLCVLLLSTLARGLVLCRVTCTSHQALCWWSCSLRIHILWMVSWWRLGPTWTIVVFVTTCQETSYFSLCLPRLLLPSVFPVVWKELQFSYSRYVVKETCLCPFSFFFFFFKEAACESSFRQHFFVCHLLSERHLLHSSKKSVDLVLSTLVVQVSHPDIKMGSLQHIRTRLQIFVSSRWRYVGT